MASDDFYVVNSWMIDDLGLSGTELQCFAIIWSLSRGKKQMYIAGNSHLVKMTKMTEHTIITTLKSLCEKGYIKKIPTKVNNVARNYYKAITKGCKNFSDEESQNDKRYCNNYSGTPEKSSAPNKESNKESNNKEKTKTKVLSKKAEEQKVLLTDDEQRFIAHMEKEYGWVQKMKVPLTFDEYMRLHTEFKYEFDQIEDILSKMDNYPNLHKSGRIAYKTALNWLKREYPNIETI